MAHAFDARAFDLDTFDCDEGITVVETSTGTVSIRPTLGGWYPATRTEPNWAPNDLARGTQWNATARGTSTW